MPKRRIYRGGEQRNNKVLKIMGTIVGFILIFYISFLIAVSMFSKEDVSEEVDNTPVESVQPESTQIPADIPEPAPEDTESTEESEEEQTTEDGENNTEEENADNTAENEETGTQTTESNTETEETTVTE